MKRAWAVLLLWAVSSAFAVRVEWLTRPKTYVEGQTVRVEARVTPEADEWIWEVRVVALPSGKSIFVTQPGKRGGTALGYWNTTGYGGTTALRLEVSYSGRAGNGTAYALLPVSVQGTGLGAQQVQAQGFIEDLDRFVNQACQAIGYFNLATVRWVCTAKRTVQKAQRYWEQLGHMWEDFKDQVMYYGTGMILDWVGKAAGLHMLNPIFDQVDNTLDTFMSEIRAQKNALIRALAKARAAQIQEIENWQAGQDFPRWGPEWWSRFVAQVVPQLGFQATEQAIRDIQRTVDIVNAQAKIAEQVATQQEEANPSNALQDLWDTLGTAWNFVKEAVAKGWASLTGAVSGSSAEGPGGVALPLGGASVPGQVPSSGSVPGGGVSAMQTPPPVQGQDGGQNGGQGGGLQDALLPDGTAEKLVNEAETAVSTREVTEVLVKGFAEMLKLEAMSSMRVVQELKNLASNQVATTDELAKLNKNLVDLIKAQEKNVMDELRRGIAYVTARADELSGRFIAMGEALEEICKAWAQRSEDESVDSSDCEKDIDDLTTEFGF